MTATRYLSDDWIEASAAVVARNAVQLWIDGGAVTIGLTTVVTDVAPGVDAVYHLDASDGTVSFGPGAAVPEHVRLQQSLATATAVAKGQISAQEAFIGGLVVLRGDQQRLLDAQRLLVALERILAPVRQRTTYSHHPQDIDA